MAERPVWMIPNGMAPMDARDEVLPAPRKRQLPVRPDGVLGLAQALGVRRDNPVLATMRHESSAVKHLSADTSETIHKMLRGERTFDSVVGQIRDNLAAAERLLDQHIQMRTPNPPQPGLERKWN